MDSVPHQEGLTCARQKASDRLSTLFIRRDRMICKKCRNWMTFTMNYVNGYPIIKYFCKSCGYLTKADFNSQIK